VAWGVDMWSGREIRKGIEHTVLNYSFPIAAVTDSHKFVAYNNINIQL
jgi:hypothetical protein